MSADHISGTLQIALKVLSELRKGRMVGVISHVQELKRQIPQRIDVISGRGRIHPLDRSFNG